ncbi:uncharacterized protein LOC143375434 [Andrena cerasifolii]|uniref:uncharacterized protein LOC143375434 n=1 Tax=Andrena cerasifolii TaxID=2819439 RepID=UPI0040382632
MSQKLAAKQKEPLTLNGDSLLRQKSKLKTRCWYSKPYKLAIFCVLSCSFFLVYWIILGPLLISEFQAHNAQKTDKWAVVWLSFYWFIAFLIWVFVMLCLLLICKRMDSLEKDHNFQTYGTGISIVPSSLITTKRDRPRSLGLPGIIEEKPPNELTSDESKTNVVRDKRDTDASDEAQRSKPKRHIDLPPLVIHGHISGKDKRSDTMNLEEDVDTEKEGEEAPKSGGDVPRSRRESMQAYLKLVTVTPDDEVDVQSPNKPLSPRELFFIDLIREAEKAEEAKSNKNPEGSEGEHFLPSDSTPTAKKSESVEIPIPSVEDEATYFIANVDSPKSTKTEVFLEISPDPRPVDELSAGLINEKPILLLRENSQARENRNANAEVVIFEI